MRAERPDWGNPKPKGAHDYNDRLCATLGWSGGGDERGPDSPIHLLLWHRTPGVHEWLAGGVGAHDFPGKKQHELQHADLATLTLSPSVYWPECCGMHGFLTDGVWRDV